MDDVKLYQKEISMDVQELLKVEMETMHLELSVTKGWQGR